MQRVIIGAAILAAYLFVILATISGGLGGYLYGRTIGSLGIIGDSSGLPIILGIIGLIAGFLLASLSAAVLFLLREIAANTRQPVYDAYGEPAGRGLR